MLSVRNQVLFDHLVNYLFRRLYWEWNASGMESIGRIKKFINHIGIKQYRLTFTSECLLSYVIEVEAELERDGKTMQRK